MIANALGGGFTGQVFQRSGIGLQAETVSWRDRVVTNGGTVSSATLLAVDAFVRGCKSDSIWTKLSRVNLFCGDQLAACLVPLVVGSGNATETGSGFVSGDYAESTGLTTNAVKYLDTGFDPYSAGQYAAMGVYLGGTVSSAGGVVLGARGTTSQTYAICNQSSLASGTWGGSLTSNSAVGPTILTAGYWATGRTNQSDLYLAKDGATVATFSTSTTPVQPSPARGLYVGGLDNNGSPGSRAAAVVRGYLVGPLSAAEHALVYARILAFQTTLGRQA